MAKIDAETMKVRADNANKRIELENMAFEAAKGLVGKESGLAKVIIGIQKAIQIARVWTAVFASNAIITAEAAALAIPSFGASIAMGASLIAANNINAGLQTALIAGQGIIEIAGFAKGTKDSPEGLAFTGEKGTELIRTPDGKQFLTPNSATLTWLPKHSEVVPNHLIQQELSDITQNGDIIFKQDNQLMQELISTIKNKKESHISIDRNGFKIAAKQGNNITRFLNDRYRC